MLDALQTQREEHDQQWYEDAQLGVHDLPILSHPPW
jgi:hypothetical protein